MLKLNKKRDFGAIIGDAFDVFKKGGKTYFSNYFKINGGILLLLILLIFLFSRIIIDGAFATRFNTNENDFLSYMMSNLTAFIVFGTLLALGIIVATIVNYLYPIGFLKLIDKKEEITTSKLVHYIKSNIPKTLSFFFLSLFTMFPLLLIVTGINLALCFIIIGFPLLLIVLPAIQCLISLSFYTYLNNEVTFLESWQKGFKYLKSNFWHNVGATLTMHMIVQTALGIFVMIPYLGMIFFSFSNPGSNFNEEGKMKLMLLLFINIIFTISIVGNYLLQNVILINQGIIYYSSKEISENNSLSENIDAIGQDNE